MMYTFSPVYVNLDKNFLVTVTELIEIFATTDQNLPNVILGK